MKSSIRTALAAFAAFTVLATTAQAKPGDLDLAFSFDGKVTTDFGGTSNAAYASAVQSDGKLIVAGSSTNGTQSKFAIVRYNIDGSYDGSFGTDGRVTTDFPNHVAVATTIAFRPAGNSISQPAAIIVGGYSLDSGLYPDYDFALVRYNAADGSLDTSFGGGDGKVTTNFESIGTNSEDSDRITSMALQPVLFGYKIVVAGYAHGSETYPSSTDFALARYLGSGALDTTFGTGGKVFTDFGGGSDRIIAMILQEDGKILAGGQGYIAGAYRFLFCRYKTDGSLDGTFGSLGKVTIDFPGVSNAVCTGLTVLPGGKILAAGQGTPDSSLLSRFHPDGSLDTSFGTGGIVVNSSGIARLFSVNSLAEQADGKILLAGPVAIAGSVGSYDFGIVRYTANGALDKGFGTGGRATANFGSTFNMLQELAIRSDGSIVAVGYHNTVTGSDFAVARFKTAQGDARIGLNASVPRGNDRYNTTGAGQTQSVGIPCRGGTETVVVGIQNDTAAPDSFKIKGSAGNGKFKVKYLHGDTNVTTKVLNGTLTTGTLTSGAIYQLKARVTATTSVKGKTRDFSIIPSSAADPTAKDRALIKATSR
ncbi:MAG: delta-60 repeat domain-containing protein [Verrucomicrobiota bacterium]